MSHNTLTQWCAYNGADIRIGVVFPLPDGGYAVSNRTSGGYPVRYATPEDARRVVELFSPSVSRWDVVEVPQ